MKVAVVIPLYNHERYVGAALASLRAQTRAPDRIIVVDDGSTDGSVAAVAGLAGIELVRQPNAGAHQALNRGIELAAECDYVGILNSDDCYHPRRIEVCLEYLQAHPALDLVCTRLRLIDEAGEPLAAEAPRARWFSAAWSYEAADLAAWLGFANFPGTTSNFFARAGYLRAHPFADYRFVHDYRALLLAALDNRLGIVDDTLLDYRIHSANTISTEPEHLIREMLRLNLHLTREMAARLSQEVDLRGSFARYQRAAWNSISAFRADLCQIVLAEALTRVPATFIDDLVAGLDAVHFPEIARFPHKAVLASDLDALKAKLTSAQAEVRAWAAYRQMQAALLASRWFALGNALGLTRPVTRAGGKTGVDKLAVLRQRLAASGWMRLGAALRIQVPLERHASSCP